MRLIIFDADDQHRRGFYPISLSRPVWDLRCGLTTLADKLIAKTMAADVAYWVPQYLAAVCRQRTDRRVNDPVTLQADDLLIVNARVKAEGLNVTPAGRAEIAVGRDGEVLYVRIPRNELSLVRTESLDVLLDSARNNLQNVRPDMPTWNHIWDLVTACPDQIRSDFNAYRSANRAGISGKVEEPRAIRGSIDYVHVDTGAVVHPFVVIDSTGGPVVIDQGAEIHPFTRLEGPCYIGRNSIIYGAKICAGTAIGPNCRVGGEVEQSIIQGFSNKHHDGFLGHSYVGEWVNFGALTSVSDLRNDYGEVKVRLEWRGELHATGQQKIGVFIGDHCKTGLCTLLNTGAVVGPMTMLAEPGRFLPRHIPAFCTARDGELSEQIDRKKLYEVARAAMARRKTNWTPADESLWDEIHARSADHRAAAAGPYKD
ncbi:MAG: hypothetical protein HZA50_05475 [Planctomycetes bacterium]|nr:hypothetical protein [Planctomycetota bacterium]